MCITGPSGCGKTECIRTLGAAHREMGHQVKTDIVCTEAVESEELLGYVDPDTRFVKNTRGSDRLSLNFGSPTFSYLSSTAHVYPVHLYATEVAETL